MIIRVHNLGVRAVIGILPHERNAPQRLHVNAAIEYSFEGEEDHYVDYAVAIEEIERMLKEGQYGLIETALTEIAGALLALSDRIRRVELSIEKPDIFPHAAVSVTHVLEREP